MQIWMLFVFAVCMLSGVLSFGAGDTFSPVPLGVFFASLTTFLAGIGLTGIRRPVI